MPSSERRARERADVRERIIAAAMKILMAEGTAALTMRRVASDMDYTAPVIYQHFANKDALIAEVVRQGYDELVGRLDAVQHAPDIDARLAGMAAEYLHFASENEHLFEAMNGTALSADERRAAAQSVIGVMWNLVDEWAQRHRVELEIDEACDIIWGTLYGVATLGRLGTFGEDRARRLGVQALDLLLRGWRCTT
ncbi:TetR/AcrR family transcriptional regulator [Kineococcus radiotolerans]|uniref:Transcriptional regulator, TetR family n=1 Tax=Kineococcus radiotolerans (strain ATCC BAA-149 / DSM 14245 / SRS30216) TaxID=266940 RepID=A6WB88_KINRD|nr:TetR/AcrR family transcriptional regulator [Kineococcus radiotolerans]ABS04077.1 transcriptional regulator, TetR family [Kineococcus radiotolerans SRS30216 = ATCC BAA-149]